MEVEPTVHPAERSHAAAYLIGRSTRYLRQSHSGNAVLDVHADRHTQVDVRDVPEGRNEVEHDAAVADAHILGMEVALLAAVGIDGDALLHVRPHLQPGMHDEEAVLAYQTRVHAEALQVGCLRAVDVEVVGIGSGDDAGIRREPVERTVELVRLYHDVRTLAVEDVVRSVVLRDAAQEGVAAHMALVEHVCRHARSGRLAVCAGHTETLQRARQRAEHLGTLLYVEAMFAEEHQLPVFVRNGRRIDHERRLLLAEGSRDEVRVVHIVDSRTLLAQLLRKLARSPVVTAHGNAAMQEVAGNSTHTNAPDAYEIYSLDVHSLVSLSLCTYLLSRVWPGFFPRLA